MVRADVETSTQRNSANSDAATKSERLPNRCEEAVPTFFTPACNSFPIFGCGSAARRQLDIELRRVWCDAVVATSGRLRLPQSTTNVRPSGGDRRGVLNAEPPAVWCQPPSAENLWQSFLSQKCRSRLTLEVGTPVFSEITAILHDFKRHRVARDGAGKKEEGAGVPSTSLMTRGEDGGGVPSREEDASAETPRSWSVAALWDAIQDVVERHHTPPPPSDAALGVDAISWEETDDIVDDDDDAADDAEGITSAGGGGGLVIDYRGYRRACLMLLGGGGSGGNGGKGGDPHRKKLMTKPQRESLFTVHPCLCAKTFLLFPRHTRKVSIWATGSSSSSSSQNLLPSTSPSRPSAEVLIARLDVSVVDLDGVLTYLCKKMAFLSWRADLELMASARPLSWGLPQSFADDEERTVGVSSGMYLPYAAAFMDGWTRHMTTMARRTDARQHTRRTLTTTTLTTHRDDVTTVTTKAWKTTSLIARVATRLTAEDLEAFIQDLLPHLRFGRDCVPWLLPYYLCHCSMKFFFMLDVNGYGSLPADVILRSDVMSELVSLHEVSAADAIMPLPIGAHVEIEPTMVGYTAEQGASLLQLPQGVVLEQLPTATVDANDGGNRGSEYAVLLLSTVPGLSDHEGSTSPQSSSNSTTRRRGGDDDNGGASGSKDITLSVPREALYLPTTATALDETLPLIFAAELQRLNPTTAASAASPASSDGGVGGALVAASTLPLPVDGTTTMPSETTPQIHNSGSPMTEPPDASQLAASGTPPLQIDVRSAFGADASSVPPPPPSPSFPAISPNWFSLPVMLRVYQHFCQLDSDGDGMLTLAEFQLFGDGSLTELAARRVFEVYVPAPPRPAQPVDRAADGPPEVVSSSSLSTDDNGGGNSLPSPASAVGLDVAEARMDFRVFVNFVLATEHPNSRASFRYYWKLLDLHDTKSYIDVSVLRVFCQEIAGALQRDQLIVVSGDSILSELVDMIGQQPPPGDRSRRGESAGMVHRAAVAEDFIDQGALPTWHASRFTGCAPGITSTTQPDRIFFSDVVESGQAATLLPILLDYRAFYRYEKREEQLGASSS